MSKFRMSSELKKFLAILVLLLIVMTPFGKHALIGTSNWIGKKVAGSITHSLPKITGPTPSSTTK